MKYLKVKKNTEFQKIFAVGKRGFSSHLTLLYSPLPRPKKEVLSAGKENIKMGICVSKKHGNSVTRNKVKRLLREIFRLNFHLLKENYNYILLPRVAQSYDYHTLERDFLYIVKKQGLFKADDKITDGNASERTDGTEEE